VEKTIRAAYGALDLEEVRKVAGYRQPKRAAEARKLLQVKEKSPVFDAVDYWWLDELVASISFGEHTYPATQLAQMPPEVRKNADDRTVTIHWRCGIATVMPSGVVRDSHHPRHKAELWDNYILRYPERYPNLTEEVRKKRGITE
jgi:hypothetical protein